MEFYFLLFSKIIFIIKDIAFDSIVNEVKTGKADFGAAGISYSPERAENVDFSNDYSTYESISTKIY